MRTSEPTRAAIGDRRGDGVCEPAVPRGRTGLRRLAPLALLGLALAGCHTAPRGTEVTTLARFLIETNDARDTVATLPLSGVRVPVSAKPVISEFDIVSVDLVEVELGRCLRFQLTPAAARDLYRLTASRQGRRLVLTLDGAPVGARRIERPFEDGAVMLFVELPDAELPALVQRLRTTSAELQRAAARAA